MSQLSHHMHAEAVAGFLGADLQTGLPEREVRERQARFGPNRLSGGRGRSAWSRWLGQFTQPLVYLLLIAGLVSAGLREWVDAGVILGVVLVNALVGFLQEGRAERALSSLEKLVQVSATVVREGQRLRISAQELVPGDVVLLSSGEQVPADLRLVQVRGLRIDEAMLTGESLPVDKQTNPLAADTVLADRRNMAYAGTLVAAGQGRGVVWAIGDETETGHIARLLRGTTDLSTPLVRKLESFSRLLLWLILGLSAVAFVVGLLRGFGVVEMFMAAVALAVGAIPEGLPAAVTITLAIGVARMARRRAIIRRLPAVETLGSTTVICSDKTGTLTQNQMTVGSVWAGGRLYEVTGSGYEPRGDFILDGQVVVPTEHVALIECLRAGVLANDSQVVRRGDSWHVDGDPTDAALIVALRKAESRRTAEVSAVQHYERLDAIPFESEYQFMATLHTHPGGRVIYKKGAVERIVDRCHNCLLDDGSLGPLDRDAIRTAAEAMAVRGLRVLALCRREVPTSQDHLDQSHVAAGMTFVGLQGMMDPPRPEAIRAIEECLQAGIAVKMITGDHLLTARSVARVLGLRATVGTAVESGAAASQIAPAQAGGDQIAALSGREIERMSDAELSVACERTQVFARIAPEQKLRLVRALQGRGHVVAMTGDGVNDAPALRQADIGIAMGQSGTDVAKDASSMLLTDDNFATIVAAIEEGRGVFDNLMKFLIWTLPTNTSEALVLLTAIALGTALPVLPVQILWINMATVLFLGLTLIFEPRETDLMRRAPRDPKQPILTYELFMRTGLVSLITLAGAFALFEVEQHLFGASLPAARTAVVHTIVAVDTAYLFSCRSLLQTVGRVGFFSNPWIFVGVAGMWVAEFCFSQVALFNRMFHSSPLGAGAWLRIALVGVCAYVIVEFEKLLRRRFSRRPMQIRDGASSGTDGPKAA